MKAYRNLESRVSDLENKVYDLSNVKKSKMNQAKSVLSSILILEKVWKLIKRFLSELDL